ncbi:hypothetical protein AFL01nite_10630 [Aeromicrobium flavum]|uniref:Uncharacterized protein n=1 Tax=Aeromicrobium flavum TaxID=416568 RepID=A0A512HTF4_9ACTN|nr:hypothetical protein [Aeromicrobium flavum]GEO88736.1 hypothetical protein AFL01nite_10630 [Aeromicrobium flavum]
MNTHPVRWDALVFGVLFALVVAAWAALFHGWVTVENLVVAGPVALIVAGIAGIALTLRSSNS